MSTVRQLRRPRFKRFNMMELWKFFALALIMIQRSSLGRLSAGQHQRRLCCEWNKRKKTALGICSPGALRDSAFKLEIIALNEAEGLLSAKSFALSLSPFLSLPGHRRQTTSVALSLSPKLTAAESQASQPSNQPAGTQSTIAGYILQTALLNKRHSSAFESSSSAQSGLYSKRTGRRPAAGAVHSDSLGRS